MTDEQPDSPRANRQAERQAKAAERQAVRQTKAAERQAVRQTKAAERQARAMANRVRAARMLGMPVVTVAQSKAQTRALLDHIAAKKSSPATATVPAAAAIRYEYKEVAMPGDPKRRERQLNKLAKQGWEYVSEVKSWGSAGLRSGNIFLTTLRRPVA